MIYDMHCHLLPRVDDGSEDMEQTKEMLRMADLEGIDIIVATPHFHCGGSEPDAEKLKEKYHFVRNAWKEYGEGKELLLGSELFFSDGLTDALQEGRALTLHGTRYILVEFPTYVDFPYLLRAVQSLRYAGYRPIVAHVERFGQVTKPIQFQELRDAGAHLQVNVSTVLGQHGRRVRHRMIKLLKSGLIEFVGSDAHDTKERRPVMRECRQYLNKKLGAAQTRQILEKNPGAIFRGEKLHG